MIKDYASNINEILEHAKVEGVNLNNKDILKKLFNDSDINNTLFEKFSEYFLDNFEIDDLYMKCEDLVLNVHSFVSDFLIGVYGLNDYDEIKDILLSAIDNKADFYGAYDYEGNKEAIDNLKDYYSEDIKI